jgi:hypothetical protein
MIVNSPNIQLKISPNLKYIALLHGNSLLLYRERTFLFEKNVKGLDLKLIAVSDKGDVLIQTQSELILIDLNQQETILNNKFKEGGILSDFNLLNKKIFFYRKTQDKSFLNILAKKEVYLHELGMLNLETSKEEIFFSKKMESNDNIEFKLSPFSNYIIIKDKKIVEKINLSNYKVELSYELSDIQIVDYYINNSGDIVFYIRDKDKEALYFISNNSKFIIKLPEEVKDSIIISFNPNKIVLRLKTYPQIFILNKLGNIELKFLLNDIENLNYPMWAVLFPTYEDIIALYLRQFKLPLDMFYFTYENFRVEVSRWRVTEFKKAKTEDKLASLLEESIKEREQIIEQKSKEIEKFQKEISKHHKEDIQQQTQGVTEKAVVDSEKLMKLTFDSVESKVENIDTSKLVNLFEEENQQEEQETKGVLNKLEDQSQDQKNIYKKVVSEDELLKKALSETKEQAKSINYDISKLTKFLEEDSNEENNSEIINKLGNEDEQVKKPKLKIDFDKVLYDKEQTIKEKETKKLDLNTILTDEPKNEIKKDLNSPKSIESPKKLVIEEFEKLLENVENKIEKSQKIESKDLKDSVIKTETIKSESGLEIEIKKQLTPEDIKKITKEKEELLKQINELNFLKSIGDIDEEEYNKKINEIKKRLEEIKELLASNK